MAINRRQWLGLIAAQMAGSSLPLWAAQHAPSSNARFFAAWRLQTSLEYQIGVLRTAATRLRIQQAITVPTRAHGLLRERNGDLLAVARRPGDWLLRWRPTVTGKRAETWVWNEPDRVFNGHLLASADGRHIYTTETNLETGQGLIGVRDQHSLERIAEWPTHGMDPHELLLDADGDLIIANGGIPTLPETGRIKRGMERMDSSLVRLSHRDGKRLGQWRVGDQRLSLRHLAWVDAGKQQLAIAIQAEHDDDEARSAAPVLALFNGEALHLTAQPNALAGYGGSVAAAHDLIAIACPRANGIALWNSHGKWQGFISQSEACPLAHSETLGWWSGGSTNALSYRDAADPSTLALPSLQLDNHWMVLPF